VPLATLQNNVLQLRRLFGNDEAITVDCKDEHDISFGCELPAGYHDDEVFSFLVFFSSIFRNQNAVPMFLG
jgi:hypothetical protein